MGLFTRRKEIDPQATAQALDLMIGRIAEAQAKNIETMSTFLQTMGELSMRKAAAVLGSRGGKARVANAKKKQEQAKREASDCPLCRDPFFAHGLTNSMIDAHASHKAAQQPLLPMPNGELN